MEEKYLCLLPCLQIPTNFRSVTQYELWETSVTVYVTVIMQSCKLSDIFDKWPHEPTQPPEVCTKWPQMVFSVNAGEIWVWKGIKKSEEAHDFGQYT